MINRSEGDENLLSLKGIINDYSTELSQVQGYLSLSHLGRGPGTDMLISYGGTLFKSLSGFKENYREGKSENFDKCSPILKLLEGKKNISSLTYQHYSFECLNMYLNNLLPHYHSHHHPQRNPV